MQSCTTTRHGLDPVELQRDWQNQYDTDAGLPSITDTMQVIFFIQDCTPDEYYYVQYPDGSTSDSISNIRYVEFPGYILLYPDHADSIHLNGEKITEKVLNTLIKF
jgi:hypothetical protein